MVKRKFFLLCLRKPLRKVILCYVAFAYVISIVCLFLRHPVIVFTQNHREVGGHTGRTGCIGHRNDIVACSQPEIFPENFRLRAGYDIGAPFKIIYLKFV